MARRARSVDRAEEGLLYRLGEVLDQALRQPPTRDRFKAPSFDGTGDVGFFISQFEDVARANQWDEASARIHIRASLTDAATSCGQAEDMEHIIMALRARFGTTSRQAKAKLAALKKDQQTSLQEHAAEVDRLVGIAYEELPRANQQDMKLDIFQTSLSNPYLQRHLLAIQPGNLEEATRAGNEYLQIKTFTSNSTVRQVEEEEEGHTRQVADPMKEILKAMARLTEEVNQLKAAPHQIQRPDSNPRPRCYGCNKTGHLRSQCPTRPWPARQSGNETGPQ